MKQGVFKVYPVSSPQATFLNSFYFNSSSWWLVGSGLKTQFSSSQIWSYFVTTVTCYWPWWLINWRSCSGLGTAIKKPTGRRGYSLGKPGQRGRHIATTCRHCYWATSSTRASVLCHLVLLVPSVLTFRQPVAPEHYARVILKVFGQPSCEHSSIHYFYSASDHSQHKWNVVQL